MKIKVNGKDQELPAPISVQTLTERFGIPLTRVAIERNREIVPRSLYGEVMLENGDSIEIVHFIGGG